MKHRNRKKTGRFITQNRLPKEKPTLREIAQGQSVWDERKVTKQERANGSPYWGHMETHGQQADGEILESPFANPDTLGYTETDLLADVGVEETINKHAVYSALTKTELEIMQLWALNVPQDEIASKLGIKQPYVSRTISVVQKKVKKMFTK